jgi:hypothetical protein
MIIRTRQLITALAFAASFVASQSSRAAEPQNDIDPWAWWTQNGELRIFDAKGTDQFWGIGHESIEWSGDVDFVGFSCAGRTVKAASIHFSHAAGDLDMRVYDFAGNQLGISQGYTDQERVDVSAFGKQLLVVKTYGWGGAMNEYGLTVECN